MVTLNIIRLVWDLHVWDLQRPFSMIHAIGSNLCGDYQLWQLHRNIVSSTEPLKKCCCSSLGLAFKPADLKQKGAEG